MELRFIILTPTMLKPVNPHCNLMAEIRRQICVHWTSADTLLANARTNHSHARTPAIQKSIPKPHEMVREAGLLCVFCIF